VTGDAVPELVLAAVTTVGVAFEARVATEFDTTQVSLGKSLIEVGRTVFYRWVIRLRMFSVFLYFLYNLIEQIIKEFVSILMHRRPE
jgi:hypothetical protein